MAITESSIKRDIVAIDNWLAVKNNQLAVKHGYKTDADFSIRKNFRNNRLVIKAFNRTDTGNELAIVDDGSITGVGNLMNVRLSTRVNTDVIYDINNGRN